MWSNHLTSRWCGNPAGGLVSSCNDMLGFSLNEVTLCDSVLMWRLIIFIDRNAAGMLHPPQVWHQSAHARPVLRVQVCSAQQSACDVSIRCFTVGSKQLKQMSLLERIDWRVGVYFYSTLYWAMHNNYEQQGSC